MTLLSFSTFVSLLCTPWVPRSLSGLLLEHNIGDVSISVFAQAWLVKGVGSNAYDPAVAQFASSGGFI